MPWVVLPEQSLLCLSDNELYQELISLRDRPDPKTIALATYVFEFNVTIPENVSGGGPGRRWDPVNKCYVRSPFKDSRSYVEGNGLFRFAVENTKNYNANGDSFVSVVGGLIRRRQKLLLTP